MTPTTPPARARRDDEGKVTTLHPAGKNGVRIDGARYDTMRQALLAEIPRRADGVAFGALADLVRPHLDPDAFDEDTSVQWYVVTVKQDLEARGLVEQVPKASPQRLRRVARRSSPGGAR